MRISTHNSKWHERKVLSRLEGSKSSRQNGGVKETNENVTSDI